MRVKHALRGHPHLFQPTSALFTNWVRGVSIGVGIGIFVGVRVGVGVKVGIGVGVGVGIGVVSFCLEVRSTKRAFIANLT